MFLPLPGVAVSIKLWISKAVKCFFHNTLEKTGIFPKFNLVLFQLHTICVSLKMKEFCLTKKMHCKEHFGKSMPFFGNTLL